MPHMFVMDSSRACIDIHVYGGETRQGMQWAFQHSRALLRYAIQHTELRGELRAGPPIKYVAPARGTLLISNHHNGMFRVKHVQSHGASSVLDVRHCSLKHVRRRVRHHITKGYYTTGWETWRAATAYDDSD